MICPKCGAQNKDEAVYCKKCGSRLPVIEEDDYYVELPEEDDGSLLTKILIAVGVVVFLLVFTVFLFLIIRNHARSKPDPDSNQGEISVEEVTREDVDERTTSPATASTIATEAPTEPPVEPQTEEAMTPIDVADQYKDLTTREPVEYNGHAYALFDYKKLGLKKDFFACEKKCEEMGGHLAVIDSEDENDALFNYAQENGETYAYFGFTDEGDEGNWRWVDGSPVNYTNWCTKKGQPNNRKGEEHYAQFYGEMGDGTWCDAKFASGSYKFICEWE